MSAESDKLAAVMARPLPKPEGDAERYWRALGQGRIELPRCRSCGRIVFVPRAFCPSCLSRDLAWEALDGNGTIYTFSVVHKPTHPAFFGDAPYVYALVELPAGVRLPTRVVGSPPASVRVGAPVEPVFERATDEVTLLHFKLRRPA